MNDLAGTGMCHGTTTAGYQEPSSGVVLGADGKLSSPPFWNRYWQCESLDHCKIEKFLGGGDGFKLSGAWAGWLDECEAITHRARGLMGPVELLDDNLKLRFIWNGIKHTLGTWNYTFCGSMKEEEEVHIPFLFQVVPFLETYGDKYYCGGTGGRHAEVVLNSIPKDVTLSLTEMIAWVERALVYAAVMDHFSGGVACVTSIGTNGDRVVRFAEILTTLREKHLDFFRHRRAQTSESDYSAMVCQFSDLSEERQKYWMYAQDLSEDTANWKNYTF